jgi:hypothetical protein
LQRVAIIMFRRRWKPQQLYYTPSQHRLKPSSSIDLTDRIFAHYDVEKIHSTIGTFPRIYPFRFLVSSKVPQILPPDISIGEERELGYDLKHFYPVKLRDIFNEVYQR